MIKSAMSCRDENIVPYGISFTVALFTVLLLKTSTAPTSGNFAILCQNCTSNSMPLVCDLIHL